MIYLCGVETTNRDVLKSSQKSNEGSYRENERETFIYNDELSFHETDELSFYEAEKFIELSGAKDIYLTHEELQKVYCNI